MDHSVLVSPCEGSEQAHKDVEGSEVVAAGNGFLSSHCFGLSYSTSLA